MAEPDKSIVDTRVRIPTTLYERIKALAQQERRSINSQMLVLLERAVRLAEQERSSGGGNNRLILRAA